MPCVLITTQTTPLSQVSSNNIDEIINKFGFNKRSIKQFAYFAFKNRKFKDEREANGNIEKDPNPSPMAVDGEAPAEKVPPTVEGKLQYF